MANYQRLTAFIQQWEGKLSNNPDDKPPALDPCPVDPSGKPGGGYHTNIGVTWTNFKLFGPSMGYQPTPALFYQMPSDIWSKIMKVGYWDKFSGDQIKSQAIADIMQNWAFMSGPGEMVMKLQQFLGISQDGKAGPYTIAAINKRSAEDDTKFASDLLDFNLKFFLSLLSKRPFFVGWTNRLSSLRTIVMHDTLNSPSQLFPPK